MNAKVYGLDGKQSKSISLPHVFSEDYKPALILKAFTAKQSHMFQPHGSDPLAGLRTTAEYIGRRDAYRSGINKGIGRLPHEKTGGGGIGTVKRVPQSRGGRRSHPPKIEKVLIKALNKKEQALAMRSAIGATTRKELVEGRGHKFTAELPIVVDDKFEALKKTSEVIGVLERIGLTSDLARGRIKKVRAGQSRMRGNKHLKKKTALIVVANADVIKACRNIPGVDAITTNKLNIELLAPGSHAGRLTVWTEGAIKQVGEKYGD
jgi:large subunit ribosomal protein L4e